MKHIFIITILILIITPFATTGANEMCDPLCVTRISPNQGPIGTMIEVYGGPFTPMHNSVAIGSVEGVATELKTLPNYSLSRPSDWGKIPALRFSIPSGLCPVGEGCDAVVIASGKYPLRFTNGDGGISNTLYFTITPFSSAPNNPTTPSSKSTFIFLEVRDVHTRIPISNAAVTVIGTNNFKTTLTTNSEGMVKKELPVDVKVNTIRIEATDYKKLELSGKKLQELIEGKSTVTLERINPPKEPPFDPLRPQEDGNTKQVSVNPAPHAQGFWARIVSFFFGWRVKN